jgi:hypothetical protein
MVHVTDNPYCLKKEVSFHIVLDHRPRFAALSGNQCLQELKNETQMSSILCSYFQGGKHFLQSWPSLLRWGRSAGR